MEMEVRIKVQVNEDVEVTLTEKEARVLYNRLKQLFGDNYIHWPTYPPGTREPDWNWPKITYFKDEDSSTGYNTGTGAEVPSPRGMTADQINSSPITKSRPDDLH